MKKFDEMKYEEQEHIVKLFNCWLKSYTQEVVVKVLEKRDEIINNDFTMKLLNELYERTEKENNEYISRFNNLLRHFEWFKTYDVHNNCLTHSSAYREVLYDLYIK